MYLETTRYYFWKIYEEYQQENKKTAADRVRLYEGTAMAYRNMTPQIADSLANLYFSNRITGKRAASLFMKKFKSAINPTIALNFTRPEVVPAHYAASPDHATDTHLWATAAHE